ncbi:type II toxin-antitoxin system HicA family toxin [Adhaeretor mobilis]|uniref:hypothetical protein n=1 Tax=Adhaeretor mobilis TaxID=1930276 RepID=UPI001C54CA57|nr:hypothetical protein [Adhaeretor mobilis]
MKRRDLIRHLMDHDCELLREGGKHSWWVKQDQLATFRRAKAQGYLRLPRTEDMP